MFRAAKETAFTNPQPRFPDSVLIMTDQPAQSFVFNPTGNRPAFDNSVINLHPCIAIKIFQFASGHYIASAKLKSKKAILTNAAVCKKHDFYRTASILAAFFRSATLKP